MLQRTPVQLGNCSFKRANTKQWLQELARRHQFWSAQQEKYNMQKPSIQSINIFKGILLTLERISDLLLYQCFCFSKIAISSQTVIKQAKIYLFQQKKDCNITAQIERLKKFIQKNRLPSKDLKQYDQYCLHVEASNQADKAYNLPKFRYDIYCALMLQSGTRALGHIAISKTYQEKANQFVQVLEKSLPQVRQSEQQRRQVLRLIGQIIGQLTIYPIYAEYYQREWAHLRKSILAYDYLIKQFENRHKNEALHHS